MTTEAEQHRLEEFVQLLRQKVPTPADTDSAFTVRELKKATGRGGNWVRESIRTALDAGAWEVVRVERMNMAGRMQVTPGYRPVSPKSVPRKRTK